MQKFFATIGIAACAMVLALPASAAVKSTPESKKAATAVKKTVRAAWPAEDLSGKIAAVDPAKNMVIVQDSHGTPFDLMVTRVTRIRSGGKKLKLSDLASDTSQSVTVRLIPERKGDIARSIDVSGRG